MHVRNIRRALCSWVLPCSEGTRDLAEVIMMVIPEVPPSERSFHASLRGGGGGCAFCEEMACLLTAFARS